MKSKPKVDDVRRAADFLYTSLENGSLFSNALKSCRAICFNDVYISFDIDGLDPSSCPKTGTPVPGGMSFNEASYLLYELSQRKRVRFSQRRKTIRVVLRSESSRERERSQQTTSFSDSSICKIYLRHRAEYRRSKLHLI